MKERLITLFGGLAALLLVIVLLVQPRHAETTQLSWPTSSDRGQYGLLGAQQWLERAGVNTYSLRGRYDALADRAPLAKRGNLLIVSLPQRTPTRRDERSFLKAWLARGNQVLLLVAHDDRPEWAVTLHHDETLLAELGFALHTEDALSTPARRLPKADPPPRTTVLVPRGEHPATYRVEDVHVQAHDDHGVLTPLSGRRAWVVLQERGTGHAALWQAPLENGAGAVWISAHADMFGNLSLGKGDNARLLANIVRLALGPEGTVVFDDVHQGLSDLYDARAFFQDPRLHYTLLFLVAFWLVYLLGRTARLAPYCETPPSARAVDFVRALGGLYARRLAPPAVAAALLTHFFNAVRARYRLPQTGAPVWDILIHTARIDPRRIVALRAYHERGAGVRATHLLKLSQLIATVQRELP